jgi:DNA-binding CsgD family transcriptional regulator
MMEMINLRILIITDDNYFTLGIKKLTASYFKKSFSIDYSIMSEKLFINSMRYLGELTLCMRYALVFADTQAYERLKSPLESSGVALISNIDSIAIIKKKLPKINIHASKNITLSAVSKKLSNRENVLLGYIKDGFNDESISGFMHISRKTVSSHRKNILSKLGYKNKNRMYLNELTKF